MKKWQPIAGAVAAAFVFVGFYQNCSAPNLNQGIPSNSQSVDTTKGDSSANIDEGLSEGSADNSTNASPANSSELEEAYSESESETACNPAGSSLEEVITSIPTKPYNRTNFANVVTPTTIYAFKFKTADTSEFYEGKFAASQLSNTLSNKWIVISECKGDIRRDNKPAGCSRFSSETTMLGYLLNSTFRPDLYCHLKPNTQYYANVVSPGTLTGLNENTCTSVTNCGFSFLGN